MMPYLFLDEVRFQTWWK